MVSVKMVLLVTSYGIPRFREVVIIKLKSKFDHDDRRVCLEKDVEFAYFKCVKFAYYNIINKY